MSSALCSANFFCPVWSLESLSLPHLPCTQILSTQMTLGLVPQGDFRLTSIFTCLLLCIFFPGDFKITISTIISDFLFCSHSSQFLLLSSFLVAQLQPPHCCPFSIYETCTCCNVKAWLISVASLVPCSQPVVHPNESNHLFQNISSGF